MTNHNLNGTAKSSSPLYFFKEYRRGNQEWTIQRNWQHWAHKTQDEDKQSKKQHNTICVGHHDTQTSINNVNKT